MISFYEATALIKQHGNEARGIHCLLDDALSCTLACDLYSPMDLPPFTNSAVDGYACAHDGGKSGVYQNQQGIVRAQAQALTTLLPHAAIKIMTGAPIPEGADAVAMVEDTSIEHGSVVVSKQLRRDENIRFRGEDLRAGQLIACKGITINAQMIALAAGLGLTHLPVFVPPRVAIISTGDELVKPGEKLAFGQVYYLMDAMLRAQCRSLGIHDVRAYLVADQPDAIHDAIAQACDADIVLLTGGMSKGEYDHVRAALQASGCDEIFYQGAWRPGKPLYFGKKGTTLFFGLPGNPVAAFVCFHVFVQEAILDMMGRKRAHRLAIARNDFSKKQGFTFFARARQTETNQMEFLPGQGSHQLFSLSEANALVFVQEEKAIVKAGEVVQYYPLWPT